MDEVKQKELLETLSNMKARAESLVAQYNQLAAANDLEMHMTISHSDEGNCYTDDDEDDEDDEDWDSSDEEDWNDSGCSWQSSSSNC